MAVDRSKLYFFHNTYGAEQSLLDSLPSDVEAIPAGWDEEAETTRNNKLTELSNDCIQSGVNVTLGTIPCLIYWQDAYTEIFYTDPETNEEFSHSSLGEWMCHRIETLPANWTDLKDAIDYK